MANHDRVRSNDRWYHIADPVISVFDCPMIADGACESGGWQQGGGDMDGRFLTVFPKACRGGPDQGSPCDAHHGDDKRSPFAGFQRRSGRVDLHEAIFPAVSCPIALLIDIDRNGAHDKAFKVLPQTFLIALDLHDQIVARLTGDLEGFFGSAWRPA